jgi:hypothetical protein
MKTTLDIPDDLYRLVKAKGALQGEAVRTITIRLYRGWVADSGTVETPPSALDAMRAFCGVVDSGVPDLATNPTHLEDLGDDASHHR